jgi:hypothetical protein
MVPQSSCSHIWRDSSPHMPSLSSAVMLSILATQTVNCTFLHSCLPLCLKSQMRRCTMCTATTAPWLAFSCSCFLYRWRGLRKVGTIFMNNTNYLKQGFCHYFPNLYHDAEEFTASTWCICSFLQTVVVTQNQVSCRQAEYFADPNKFVPERWIKSHPLYKQVSPYLVLPFGHGPRSCIARRLAEQNMHSVILKVSNITAPFVQTYVFKTTVPVETFWSKRFLIRFPWN